jgi:ketosteroid isomerase-like protein
VKFKYAGLVILICFVFGITRVSAQEWSSAQKEVWKTEQDCWAVMAKGDLNGFFDYFHPDYVGWDYSSDLPSTKEEMTKIFTFFYGNAKILFYEIKPLVIKVYGDIAFTDYKYMLYTEADGKKKSEKGRWTDILMKQNGKWLLIGDHGGSTEEK